MGKYAHKYSTLSEFNNSFYGMGNNGQIVTSITDTSNNVYTFNGIESWREYKWYNETYGTVYTDFRNPTTSDSYIRVLLLVQ